MKTKLRIAGFGAVLLLLAVGLGTPVQAEPAATPAEADTAAPPIRLLARTFVPEPGVDPALRAAATTQGGGWIHVLLQLYTIPTPEERAALAVQGIELQGYVPQQAWIARVVATRVATLDSHPAVRWAGPWRAEDKLSPRVQAGDFAAWAVHESGRVQVMVLLHADVPLAEGEALAAAHDGIVASGDAGAGALAAPHALTVWIDPANLPALAAEEDVLWIEEGPPPLTANNDDARRTMRVDEVHTIYELDGDGVKLFVFDGGRVSSHIAFSGRLTYVDSQPFDNHPTHVAGTAAGDGTGSPGGRDLKGVAPAALIYSAGYEQYGGTMLFWDNAGDIQADYATARNTYGVDLATNSIGSNTASNNYPCDREGDYGVSSNMIDAIVRGDNPTVGSPYIVFWAAGNERGGGITYPGRCGANFETTAPPACAKNPIHVGATNSDGDSMTGFSSWGPCDDGRMKPVVSGPGCESGRVAGGESFIYSTLPGDTYGGGGWCGTSMATPAVAGVGTLLVEQYRETTGSPSARPSNALVKTWLIHTARDLGPDGPDYIYGYGEVDADAAVALVRATDHYTTAAGLTQGQVATYTYQVPAGATELKASLAWDDYAAAAYAAPALVNDLDLEVVAPGGATTYYPFSLNPASPTSLATTAGPNTRDNQEQVRVQNPISGTWTIRVVGTTVPEGPQPFALAYSHRTAPTNCSEALTNGDFESTDSWTLSGAAQVGTPGSPPFGGSYSLRLGGSTSSAHTAYQQVAIPSSAASANLSFDWYMTTLEGSAGYGWDDFYVEVRNTSGSVLGVYDYRNDGSPEATWQVGDNIDLSAYAGQTVRVTFYAVNDSLYSTAFYVDNVSLTTCDWAGVNTPPDILVLPDQELQVNTSLDNAIDLWAYTSDLQSPASAMTFTIDNVPDPGAGVSIDSNRYVDINPALDWTGTTSVTIRATDPGGLFDTDTFSILVSDEPYIYYMPLALQNSPPLLTGTFYPVADTYVSQGVPSANFSGEIEMGMGYDHCGSEKTVRSLIQFNLSSIPTGTYVEQARLYLYLWGSCDIGERTHTVTTYRTSTSWSVSTVTWNNKPGYAETYGSRAIPSRTWGWYSFNVTDLVQKWVNGTYPNYGITLRGPESSGSSSARLDFATLNASGTTYDPYLEITYLGTAGPTFWRGEMPAGEELPEAGACILPDPDTRDLFPSLPGYEYWSAFEAGVAVPCSRD